MPRLSDLAQPPAEVQHAMKPVPIVARPMPSPKEPWSPNPFLRCPLPIAKPISPDTLRQFTRTGIPQTRIVTP